MAFGSFFFGLKQNSNNNRRGVKLNRNAVRTRTLSMEPLESRDLLSVTTGYISDSDYSALRAQYPDFNLPEEQSDLNVMTVDLNEGATALKLSDLKSAISTAASTRKSDLILVHTSTSANKVTYTSQTDEISISINNWNYGSVTIIGWGEENFTLDANQKSRVMTVSGSSTIVNLGGLIITNGDAGSSKSNPSYGGGIYSSDGTLTIANCEISGNIASGSSSYGGAIYNISGIVSLTNSAISGNTASSSYSSYAGCIYNDSGTVSVNNSMISGNTAFGSYSSSVGGIYNKSGSVTICNSEILGNTASSVGGIYNYGTNATLTITNSTISGNSASYGGGISNVAGTSTVTNSTISGNIASGSSGGGITNSNSGILMVINCTVSGNTASSFGGGICINGSGTLTVTNCIVSRNYNGNIYGALSSSSSNNLIDYDPCFVCSPQFDSNGVLTNAETMDLHLRSDSIAIDKGDDSAVVNIETDLDGNARIIGETVDIGAYEYQGGRNDEPIPYSTIVNTLNDSFDLTDNEWSLREAIYYTPEYVTITFADNLEGTIVLTLGQLQIAPITIDGNNRITIDADQKSRVFFVSAGTEDVPVVFNGLAIQNGNSSYSGGGIYNSGTLTIINSTISGNSASYNGGGIYNHDGNLTVTNCEISRNVTIETGNSSGGGIYNSGTLTVTNSTFFGNTTPGGGGGIASSGSLIVTNSSIFGNNTSGAGSGIANFYGTLTVTNCMIRGNTTSSNGGGIASSGSLKVINSSITGNTAYNDGGGIYSTKTLTVTNSTISGNKASYDGGGIYNYGTYESRATTYVYNSIIACNTVPTGKDIYTFFGSVYGYNSLSSYTEWKNESNNIVYDSELPLFIDAENDDYHLIADSQAINKGRNSYAIDSSGRLLSADLAGIPRILGRTVDLGAYEYDSRTELSVPAFSIIATETSTVVNIAPVENAVKYRIEYALNDVFTDSTIIDAHEGVNILNDLQLLQTYYVRVKSIGNDDFFDSNYSTAQSFIIFPALTGLSFSTNAPKVGMIITTTLTPADATATYQWYSGTEIINGANTSSFTVTNAQIGQTITCVATGTGDYIGTVSATSTEVPKLPLETPDTPTLTADDYIITATWSNVENASSYTLLYQIDGADGWTAVTGILGTTTSFVGVAGTTYNVKVQANGSAIYSDSELSESASIYIPIPLTSLTLSTDSPVVGTTITATLTPSNATAVYQWYCGSEKITNATGSSFRVTEAQIGQTITCVATGTEDYIGTVSATTIEIPLPLDAPNTLTLTAEDTLVTASWLAVTNASSYTVLYQIDGSDSWTMITDIHGTSTSFDGIAGAKYNVKVQANGTGNYSDSDYSTSKSIKLKTPLTGLTLSTVSPIVGTTIATELSPADATVTYQWYCGTAIINGANTSSFTVTKAQIGQTITCVATGTGDYTSSVSATTTEVPKMPLGTPNDLTFTTEGVIVTASWSSVENASAYQFEYKLSTDTEWTVRTIPDASTTFECDLNQMYLVRVKALGENYYTDSLYSSETTFLNYAAIREAYPGFNLPESERDINIIIVDLATGNNLNRLKDAIATAGTTTLPDLILVKTSASAYRVTYSSATDEITIPINASQYGAVTIIGWGEKNFTLNANQKSRVMTISDYSAIVNLGGLTITGGNSSASTSNTSYGGGIYDYGNSLTITNCTISGNTASSGGGIYKYSDSLTITNSTITRNTASSSGGGIYNSYGDFTVTNSTISGNTVTGSNSSGGGIYNTSGTLTVTNSTISENTVSGSNSSGGGIYDSGTLTVTNSMISGNSASSSGGGIYKYSGSLTATNSTISRNTAPFGGGIYNGRTAIVTNCTISENTASSEGGGIINSGTLKAINSVISGNTASSSGGGICNSSGALTVTNSTISGNSASNGGGMYYISSSTSKFYNSIIACNTATNGKDVYKSSGVFCGYNNLSSYTAWNTGTNNIVYDQSLPLFSDAKNGDYSLSVDSQAIDKGNNQYAKNAGMDETWTDISGNPRFMSRSIDIGAYEMKLCATPDLYTPSIEGNVVTIAWSGVEHASGYQFEYRLSTDPEWTVKTVSDLSSTFEYDPNQIYVVRVKALGEEDIPDSLYSSEMPIFNYSIVSEKYPEFNLPKSENDINVIFVDLATGDDLVDLKNAISTAGTTTLPDLILVLTSPGANGVTYASSDDEISISINASLYGSVTIIGWGEEKFTLEANQKSQGISITDSSTVVNLGNMSIVNGNSKASKLNHGGGIYNYYGTLTLANSVISGNTAKAYSSSSPSGGGIYNYRGSVSIINSEISKNSASSNGGGIYNEYGSLAITNSTISENISFNGGGIDNDNGNVTITNSTISGNGASSNGGGIHNTNNSSYYGGMISIINSKILRNTSSGSGGGICNFASYSDSNVITLTNCEISGNRAVGMSSSSTSYGGGGIYNYYGTVTITSCAISGNAAENGCGVYNYGTLTITNSTISGNNVIPGVTISPSGGGIYNRIGTLTITNSAILGNTTSTSGGGIYNYSGTLILNNSTISGNASIYFGGGIYNEYGPVTITNSVISGNTSSSGGGIYNYSGSLTVTNSIVGRNYNGNFYGNSPLVKFNQIGNYYPCFVCPPQLDSNGNLTNADSMDLHLRSDSIAVDKGDNTAVAEFETDVDGSARIFGGIVDIGAYEYQGDRIDEPIQYSTVVNTLNDSFDLNDNEWSLREAIYYAPEYVTITFADNLTGTIVLTLGQLEIEAPLAIDGDNRITIDADQKSRVFYVSAGTEETPVVLNGLTIQNGNDSNGGGILNYYGAVAITNSTITRNTASSSGGGIYNIVSNSTLTVTNSTITSNTASSGGGIYNYGSNSTLAITNSEISRNSASSNGGGIYNSRILTVNNSTISGNTAYNGGGMYNDTSSATARVYNTIIACNAATNGNDVYKNDSSIYDYYSLSSYTVWDGGFGNIVYDPKLPLFIDAENGDYHLVAGSQAIDMGKNAYAVDAGGVALAYDLDGSPRIVHNKVDIGAYESDIRQRLSVPAFTLTADGSTVIVTISEVDNASSYTVMYQIDGSDDWSIINGIQGTSTSFVGVVAAKYNVKVQAKGTGNYIDSEISEPSSITLAPTQLIGLTLSTTSPVVGSTIIATLNPAGATAEYQWYSGSTLINGATGASFTVTEDQIGQSIVCIATGTNNYQGSVFAITDTVYGYNANDFQKALAFLEQTDANGIKNGAKLNVNYEPNNPTTWTGVNWTTVGNEKRISALSINGKSLVGGGDFSNMTSLTTLNCYSNQLTSLDVSGCTALQTLSCYSNQLTSLDVSNHAELLVLNCNNNQLTSLDVSGCIKLNYSSGSGSGRGRTGNTAFSVTNNPLVSINISGCIALTSFSYVGTSSSYTVLETLDASGCTSLQTLNCSYGQLTYLNVSGCNALKTLSCSSNQLTSLDVSNHINLTSLNCLSDSLESLNISGCTALTSFSYNGTSSAYTNLKTLNASGCTSLQTLKCYYGQLTSLDVSECTALTYLDCGDNQLKSLGVSQNTALATLNCSSNQLTTLDVSTNTAMTRLISHANQLTSLDLSNNTALSELNCSSNQLAELNLLTNTQLTSLYIGNNPELETVFLPKQAINKNNINLGGDWTIQTISGTTTSISNNYKPTEAPFMAINDTGSQTITFTSIATPTIEALTVEQYRITALWSTVENALHYTLEYQIEGIDGWTSITNIEGSSASFIGYPGNTYNVRVKAIGNNDYSDSYYSPLQTVTIADLDLSAQNDFVKTMMNSPVLIDYRANDESTDWSLTTVQFGEASHGEFDVNEDGTIVYTPEEGFYGTDTVPYTIISPSGKMSLGSITISIEPSVVPLDVPANFALSAEETTVIATWSAVTNASSYTVMYQIDGADGWTTVTDILGTTTSFVGLAGTTYNVRVQANGTGNYSDSNYSESSSITLAVPLTQITGLTLSTDSPIVGTILTTTLTPSDATVDYQWYCGSEIITGATASSFTVTESQIGQTITCVVTGTGGYTGSVSATTSVVPALPLGTPNKPTLTAEDTLVTATWPAVTNTSSYTVEYQVDGSDGWFVIKGINGTTTSFIGTAGTTYNVRIQANGTGNYSDSSFSESSSITLAVPPTTLSGLTLSTDSPIVGTILTTTFSPSDATVEYQWYCGTTIIDNATASSFTVTTAQIGQTITCVATGTGEYTGSVSATTAVVPAIPLDTPNVPTLTAEDTLVTATWSTVTNVSNYTVQYQIDGADGWTTVTDILGTTTSFVGLAGTTYNVRVQANGAGNYSDSNYSESASITLAVPPTALTGLTLSTTTPEVGTVLTTTLSPSDATVEYQWYCGSEIITGATTSSVTVTVAQIGQTITCVATGTGDYTGSVSATTAVVPALSLNAPNAPMLTAEDTTFIVSWSTVTNASSYTVEYQADGADGWFVIKGINGTTTSFIGVAGTTYNVRVQANGTGNYTDSNYSEVASITLAVPPTQLTGLVLSNYAPEVGSIITATLDQTGATADYQWYCGSEIITGATASSFTVTAAQIGQTITCVATGTGNYTGTVSATTAVIPALPLNTPNAPTLTEEDATVTVSWSTVTNASSYTVQYQIDGTDGWTTVADILGTSTSFVGFAGTTYNVRIQANGAGNYSDSSFSESASITLAVPPTALTGLTLSTTTPEVGTVITTTLSPSDATVKYQWYSGETLITGATASSFTVAESQIGQTITCVATGTGNYTGSLSATTAVVPALPLNTPSAPMLTAEGTSITATWSAVSNASNYTVEYKFNSSDWLVLAITEETTALLIGQPGCEYSFRVKANGMSIYSDSDYSPIQTITTIDSALVAQNDLVKTTLNNPVIIDYRENDSVMDWSLVSVQFGNALHGEYVVNEDGTIVYTPEDGFYGTDGFGYVLFNPSGKTSVGMISINVNLPIAPSVQTSSSVHNPTSEMAASVDKMTDWDNCYIELWAEGVNELNAGETTITLEYNPAVYAAPVLSDCAEGASLSVSQSVLLPNGNVQVELTAQVLESVSSQTDNLFLGTVVLSPSSEDGAGVEDVLILEPVCVLDGVSLAPTVEAMPYDLIRNGSVDVNDFIAFATVFALNPGNLSPDNPVYAQAVMADFNNDGIVNVNDFILFATNYGATKKTATIPIAQASTTADSGNSEWNDEIQQTQNKVAFFEPVYEEQIQEPMPAAASSAPLLISENKSEESSMTVLDAYTAALLDLYDNQERADLSGVSDVLAETRVEAPIANYSDINLGETLNEVVDAVLEEDLLAIDWK